MFQCSKEKARAIEMSTRRSNKVQKIARLSPEDKELADTVDNVCELDSKPVNYMAENQEYDHNLFVRELRFPDMLDFEPDYNVGGVPDIPQIKAMIQFRGCLVGSHY